MTFRTSRLFTAALLAICSWPAAAQQGARAAVNDRQRGPMLEVRTLAGETLRVHQMTGKVVLIDFMTTVCPHCKMASEALQKLYAELGAKGFCPVAVALNVGWPGALKAYAEKNGLTFALATARREDVARYLNHPLDRPLRVPTLVLLDRRGRIRAIDVGWKGEDTWRARVRYLLAE
jgi:peroxiredoxin